MVMVAKIFGVLLLACVLAVSAQETKLIIDDFAQLTPPLIITLSDSNAAPQSLFTATETSGALGGERDLNLLVTSGSNGLTTIASISGNAWNVATAEENVGNSFLQYDGLDDSPALQSSGLGGIDLTNDNGVAFRLLLESDFDTFYVITVVDMNGDVSEAIVDVVGDDTTQEYVVDFDDFNGSADFSNVGAIQILVELLEDVDAILSLFAVVGPQAPPPPPPGNGFTWYTFDDDDNGRDPCPPERPRPDYFIKDDNVVYYYFFGVREYFSSASSSS